MTQYLRPRNLLRLLFCVLLVAWAIWGIPWADVQEHLQQVTLWRVLLVAALYSGTLFIKLARWQWYLRLAGLRVGWRAAARAYFAGQAVNIIGVGRFGEAARIAALAADQPQSAQNTERLGYSGQITGTVFAEKLVDVFSLGIATLLCFGVLLQPQRDFSLWRWLLPLLASALALGLGLRWGNPCLTWLANWCVTQHWLPWRTKIARLAHAFATGLQVLLNPKSLLVALGFNALIWVMMVATDMVMLWAVHLPVRWQIALTVVVVGHYAVVTNATPSNIGIFHWAVQTALGWHGISAGEALAYAVVFHLVVSTVPVLLAALFNGEQLWQLLVSKK